MNEQWLPCPYAENDYEISNYGIVRRKTGARKGNALKAQLGGNGYLYVKLASNGRTLCKRLNRLVCIAFHGWPHSNKMEAAHQDDNKLNNRADNLAWENRSKNMKDALVRGRLRRGSKHASAKLHELDIPPIRALMALGVKLNAIAESAGVHVCTINDIKAGRTWSSV